MNSADRTILEADDEVFLDVYVKKGTDEILGATMVCRHAGEMISEITLAMTASAGLGTVARTIHPCPTQAEAIKKAGDVYNRTRLTPRVQKIFKSLVIMAAVILNIVMLPFFGGYILLWSRTSNPHEGN